MFILSLIGIAITALLIYGFIEWFNKHSFEKERYRFFTTELTAAFVSSYVIMLL